MKSFLITLLLFSCSIVLLGSCNKIRDYLPKPNGKLEIYKGAAVDLWNGKATSWISVSHLGAPVEIGVELSSNSLSDLSDTVFHVVVPLPLRAKELTPFEHIHITWAGHGHPIPGPDSASFIGPHYDFRFFMTTLEEQQSIPPPNDPSAKFNVYPPEGYIPDSYVPNRFGTPGIGLHWNEKIGFPGIRKAMVLGTYDGKLTFICPMATIEELQSGNSSSIPYAQPKYFQESGTYYPTKFNIYRDASTGKEQVTLSDFVLR